MKLKIDTPTLVISELETAASNNDNGMDRGATEIVDEGVSDDEGRDISALEA